MTKPLHVIFLLCASHVATAQAPGYLGKRFYVKADALVSLSFGPTIKNNGATKVYDEADAGGFGADTRYGIQAGYAVSRYQSLAISVSRLKTGMLYENYWADNIRFYNLTGTTLGIGYLQYKTQRGAIAPFGPYFGLHLQASLLNSTYNKTLNLNPKELNIPDKKLTFYSVGLEFGQNSVLKDILLINFAVQVNLPLLNREFLSNWADNTPNTQPGDVSQFVYEASAKERMITSACSPFDLHGGTTQVCTYLRRQ
ncbi:MAG: hypothetical protein MUC59_09650 [Saprospiraceae bacterium]|nr:hypothetical protein [Saprospiraceae bacterium]